MTAADHPAEAAHARPVGPGRWMARSPLRRDRTPSVSITHGAAARVLIHDFGGDDTGAILTAWGLTWRDVCGESTAPADRGRLRQEREQREQVEAERRARTRAANNDYRRTADALDKLVARLQAVSWGLRPPRFFGEEELIARLYESEFDRLRELGVSDAA